MTEFTKYFHKKQYKLNKYDNEIYMENPLLKFQISKIKEKRHSEQIKRKAALVKIQICRNLQSMDIDDDVIPVPENIYVEKIHKYVCESDKSVLLKSTERKILQFVPVHWRKIFPNIVDVYRSEVNKHFDQTITAFSAQRILRPLKNDFVPERIQFRFKHAGKTAKYANFLVNRQRIEDNLFISYSFVRAILYLSKIDFPPMLNDYSRYTKNLSGEYVWMTLAEFENTAQKDLENNIVFLRDKWYPRVVKLIQKFYRRNRLTPSQWQRAMNCVKGLINRQLTELKIDTFKHIFDVLSDRHRIPYFIFQAIYSSNQIELYPNLNDVINTFRNIFQHIYLVGTKLPALEPQIDRHAFEVTDPFLRIEISDSYMNEMFYRLEGTIQITYKPILDYINVLQEKFFYLYSMKTRHELTQFLAEPKECNVYLRKIESFQEYVVVLQKKVQNEYFNIAMVNQSKVMMALRTITREYIGEITSQIAGEHLHEITEICNWFESIQKRAFEVPTMTETLLSNGEFMLEVKTKQMFDIQERIQRSLKVCGMLIELTDMSDAHRHLQSKTVTWIDNMKDLFEQNATQFEVYKNQFEEKLGVVTKKLVEDIDTLIPKLAIIDDMSETDKLRSYHSTLRVYIDEISCFEDYIQWINKEEKLFKLPVSQYPVLDELKNYVIPFAKLVKLSIDWLRYYYIWMDGPFEYLESNLIESTVKMHEQEFEKTQKYYRNRIKQDMLGNPILKFRGQTEDPDPEKHPVPLRLCGRMLDWIRKFQIGVYIVRIMCNSALRDRHWVEMSQIAGYNITPDAGTTLRKIIQFGLDDKLPSFEIISIGANKELQLQNDLTAMIMEWTDIVFPVCTYKDTDVKILASLDDIQVLLDDHIIKTLTMRGSAFVKPCEVEVLEWYDKLMCVNKLFEEWVNVQTDWLSLLPLFTTPDIVDQMPNEAVLFEEVDHIFCYNIQLAIRKPKVMEMVEDRNLLDGMQIANQNLEIIKSGVNVYLENKRNYFPRFYFLSNTEMLQILSETKNPLHVQPYLSKCFDGIDHLDFDEALNIHSMNSVCGERINFVRKISTAESHGCVEKWLLAVENEMIEAVRNETMHSYSDFITTDRCQWISNWPQMIILCITQMFWASDVQFFLVNRDETAMRALTDTIQGNVEDAVAQLQFGESSQLDRLILQSLIVTDVHCKDIVGKLLGKGQFEENDFDWVAQLKYFWIDEAITVHILNTKIQFGDEYIGNSERLVITPLTDRCRRSLIVAMRMHMMLFIEGPASVGKTETARDFAKAIATLCKVYNCTESVHYNLIGKFIMGLATCGALACFDNFNRIHVEVLSIIAEQLRTLELAKSANAQHFVFEGKTIAMNKQCFICVTNDPLCGGRREIPTNLKILFRPMSMSRPDMQQICEVSLISYGYLDVKVLANKILVFYRLCAELLSSQVQYDFGLANIKSTLLVCGQQKILQPLKNENDQIIYCLINVNYSKLIPQDIALFKQILCNLFGRFDFENMPKSNESDRVLMREAFNNSCASENLQPIDVCFNKMIQMYDILRLRPGLCLVGDPFSGKSTMIKVLVKVLKQMTAADENSCHRRCKIEYINPKSINLGQLFGEFRQGSYEWLDGVVSTIFRSYANDEEDDNKWMVFDGPVDPDWVENLSSALDRSRKLCLASGEMIQLTSQMALIFETKNLMQATPSMVSRCGIIYMESKAIGWESFVKSWANKSNPKWMVECKQIILDLIKWIIPQSTAFVMKHCKSHLWIDEIKLLRTTLDVFGMVMDDAVEANADDYQKFLVSWIQAAIVYSTAWGLSGQLDTESREKFDQFHKKIWSSPDDNPPPASIQNRLDVTLPSEGNLCEYVYIFKQKGSWKYWPDLVRRQEPEVSALGVQVATIDTGRYSQLLEMHIKYKKNMLLIGPSGTGKTSMFQHTLINKLSSREFHPTFVTLHASITANETQGLIMSNIIKLRRGVFGPPKGKLGVLFVDDLHRPIKDTHGAQLPIELLRQYLDYNFLFDLKNRQKVFIEDVLVTGACSLINEFQGSVCRRFLSHFNCFAVNTFSEDTVHRIFSNVLMQGFKKSGHSTDVITQVNQIVGATLKVYYAIVGALKATANKCHYVFNLRDLSRLCAGCSMLRKESVDNKRMFAKVWFHESMRVFHDRLINADDRDWLYQRMSEATVEYFKDALDQIFELYQNDDGQLTLDCANKIIFGTYFHNEVEGGEPRYEEIASWQKYSEIVQNHMDEYNATHQIKLNIVLFTYALLHLNRICRIITMPSGSGLLIGLGDSGRRSLTQIAAFICKQTVFQPDVSHGYSFKHWREDVKKVLRASGGSGNNAIFLLSDNEIVEENFLTDVSCLLSLGEVPNIWPIDEKQEVLEMVRLAAQGGNRNIDVSPAEVFSFFVNRCKQKLHIILCFSPIGGMLRNRFRLHPSLLSCCTVDWFDDWPMDALQLVATNFLTDIEMPAGLIDSIVEANIQFHRTAKIEYENYFKASGQRHYVTTASYLELNRCFKKIYESKRKKITDAISRYKGGLNTLMKATEAVNNMQTELNDLHPKLLLMADNLSKMAVEIEAKTREANAATEHVRHEQVIANEQTAAALDMERECLRDLAQAVPVLEDALQALNTLKPADITLVKSMKNPPSAVKLVMAAVCVMKGVSPDRINDPATGKKIVDYWGPSKRILGDMGFLQSLKDYDKDDINPDVMKKIRKDFIPHKDFQPHIVAKASSAAEGLCKWIKAIENFESVNTVVQPKKLKLQNAKSVLKATKRVLAEKRRAAAALEAKVEGLNRELEMANSEKRRTEEEVETCNGRLVRAEELIRGLGGEKSRWTKSTHDLETVFMNLIGDILISSAIVAYLAPLDLTFRKKCTTEWHALCQQLTIPCSHEFKFAKALGSDIQIQRWALDGLSKDEFSVGNAIILQNSSRFCLLVDPQRQANLWIRKMEIYNKLRVVKFTQCDFVGTLRQCVEFGWPMLIESIGGTLDASIEPVLHRHTFKQADKDVPYVCIAGLAVPWHENFRLYLTSYQRSPSLSPETSNKVNIINFVMTQKGLEQQLLDILISKERSDLQEQREKLIAEYAKNQALLKEYENNILQTIARSHGRILEDHTAVREMNELKQLCVEVGDRLDTTKLEQDKIKRFRDIYKPVAVHVAVIYYCLNTLHALNPMYQFSLIWYTNLYRWAIENANKSQDTERRIQFLKTKMTNALFNTVGRALYKRDKLTFTWLLTTRIMLAANKVDSDEYTFFTNGHMEKAIETRPLPCDWLPDSIWTDVQHLDQLPKFKGLVQSVIDDLAAWKNFFEHNDHKLPALPQPWHEQLDDFQKLILIRIFHPNKVAQGIREYIAKGMGTKFAYPSYCNISKSFDESTILTPLLILLSDGTDPIESVTHFARRRGYAESMKLISLGNEMGAQAANAIRHAQQQGSWVCLQNCHLTRYWLPSLEEIWEKFNVKNTKSTFRLWLTCNTIDYFPHTLLENCIKISYEEAAGLRQNLLKIYETEPVLSSKFYDGCPGKDKAFARLLYAISFFHAVALGRKEFNSIGWNIQYHINDSDFKTSVHQLQQIINENQSISYEMIFNIIAQCIYGGHIADEWDQRTLFTLLSDYLNEAVVDDPFYSFAQLNGCDYLLPRRPERREIRQYITTCIPITDVASIYGIHEYTNAYFELAHSEQLIDAIVHLPSRINEMNQSFCEFDEDISLYFTEIGEKLNANMHVCALFEMEWTDELEPLHMFLYQEIQCFRGLWQEIECTCRMAEKIFNGAEYLSPHMEEVFTAIKKSHMPQCWMTKSYPSVKPIGSYINDLLNRLDWLRKWDCNHPEVFWLSAFFHPRKFIGFLQQKYASDWEVSLIDLTYDVNVLDADEYFQEPSLLNAKGTLVSGLYMQNAEWNRELGCITEQVSRIVMHPMPIVEIYPTLIKNFLPQNRYECPVYRTSERGGGIHLTHDPKSNFVIALWLNSHDAPQIWIKRGVALILQTDN